MGGIVDMFNNIFSCCIAWQAAGAVCRVREGQPVTAGSPRGKHETLLPHGHTKRVPLRNIYAGETTPICFPPEVDAT